MLGLLAAGEEGQGEGLTGYRFFSVVATSFSEATCAAVVWAGVTLLKATVLTDAVALGSLEKNARRAASNAS
jgi:hypothetical protein